MKRILAITLTLVMLLAALTGCMISETGDAQNHLTETGDAQNHLTEAELFSLENIKSVVFESQSKDKYSFHGSSVQKIVDYFSKLCFTVDSDPDPTDCVGTGWNMQIVYEDDRTKNLFICNGTHVYIADSKYKLTSDTSIDIETLIDSLKDVCDAADHLVSHIQIKSGDNTIHPFGCMTWSKIANEDGTFTESIVDKYDVIDLVSGKTAFSKHVLRGSASRSLESFKSF